MQGHQTFITEGYILHTRAQGEADRTLTVLTPKGLLEIYARSIRKEKAKLRQRALPYRRVTLSVVRGKRDILKDITVTTPLTDIWSTHKKYVPFVQLLKTVRDHIPPADLEETHVFDNVEKAVTLLSTTDARYAKHILLVTRIHLFSTLGHLATTQEKTYTEMLKTAITSPKYKRELERQLHYTYQHL